MKEEKITTNSEEIKKLEQEAIAELSEYLKTFEPETYAPSKSSMMGPVGKLISAVASGRFENKDAIVGFIVSIHNNLSESRASPSAVARLKDAVNTLEKLHTITPRRYWLRVLREIDYGVFISRYGQVAQKLPTSQDGGVP